MKSTKVHQLVKDDLKSLKRKLQLSSESEVIAYLSKVYSETENKIPLGTHNKALDHAKEVHSQGIIS